jgi:hypothetical protein
MKNKILSIKREEWEKLREFRMAPYKKRYNEMLELEKFLEVNLN